MPKTQSPRLGVVILFLAAIVGLILALYQYFAPLTGVTHTAGALLAVAVCILLALIAMAMAAGHGRGTEIAWRIIALVLLIGNGFAGALLHEWLLCAAMIVGLVGLALRTFSPARVTGGSPS